MKFLRTVVVAAVVAAGLSLAAPANSATSWGTTISEGQYKTFTILYDGSPPDKLWGFTSTWIYSEHPNEPRYLWDIYNTNPACSLNLSGVTDCPMFPVKVTANTWGNQINLYIEFNQKDVDDCAANPSNHCALVYRPVDVYFQPTFVEGDHRDFEVVSSGGGAVPEPATWAMMIAGFGLVGSALRRRRVALAA